MDEQRFGAALRALQAGTTRREGLAGMLAVLLGRVGVSPASAAGDREAAGGPETEGPCGDGGSRANRCKKDSKCCTKYCADGACRCKPNWMPCAKGAECCSGVCASNGRCDGGAKPAGAPCRENFNCQDGLACINGVCKASKTAGCDQIVCTGCCDGTTCRAGTTSAACGGRGSKCARCNSMRRCVNGMCKVACSAQTCPNGCCLNGVCKPGTTDSACGKGGAACAACTGNKTCQAGTCRSGGGCSPATCPNGCCLNGVCKPGTEADACGTGASACVTCSNSTPYCSAGTCSAGVWGYQNEFTGVSGTFSAWPSADGLTAWVTTGNRVEVWTRPDTGITTAWSKQTSIGSDTPGPSNLAIPAYVWVTVDGLTAYIVDRNNDRISIWTRPDATSTDWAYDSQIGSGTAGSGTNQFNDPNGVWVAADQLTAYVSDTRNCRIMVWTRSDTSSAWAYQAQMGTGYAGRGTNQFDRPWGIFVSADGLTAYIADMYNNRIMVWSRPDAGSTAWAFQAQMGTGYAGSNTDQFNQPSGIFVSADGLTAYIADVYNNRIAIWTRPDASSTAWAYQTQWGTGTSGGGAESFYSPFGVFVAPEGPTAYIADTGNSRVAIWGVGAP